MASEQAAKAAKRRAGTPTPARLQGQTVTVDQQADRDDGVGSLRMVGGSMSKALNNVLANQALRTMWQPPGTADDDRDRLYSAGIAAMVEFKPQDGIEGMMAAQAFGLHTAAMECLRRAMIPEQPGEAANQLRRQGANLSRAFLDVLAALDRKRGKGVRQVVRVERVMVAPGGQAIVGNVQTRAALGTGQHGEGVGRDGQTRGEPHAPPAGLAHDAPFGAVLPPLRGADAGWDALPVARDGQRPVPDARGHQHGA